MKKNLFFVLGFLLLTGTASASVGQFVFTTPPQTVAPNTPSAQITVQSQDSSGTLQNTTETNDISFTSTSPTGQFLNPSGTAAVSTTMNSGTANKNFLYQDSTAGTYTLTVTTTGRVTHNVFTASQTITIGTAPVVVTPVATSTATTTDPNGQDSSDDISNTSSVTPNNFAYSSPASLTIPQTQPDFQVSAGRDYFTSTDNTVSFEATIPQSSDIFVSNIQYSWSFGDGSQQMGKVASHQYLFPGQYTVILNASYGSLLAVSQSVVTVITPVVSVAFVSGGVQVTNNSSGEVNLGGWTIASGNSKFSIPVDTIIGSNQSIIFPQQTTGIAVSDIQLLDPLGKVMAQTDVSTAVSHATSTQVTMLPLLVASSTTPTTTPIVSYHYQAPKALVHLQMSAVRGLHTVAPISHPKSAASTVSSTSTNMATVYVGASQSTAFDSLFNFPTEIWNGFLHVFHH